ncbi:hypothetical protein BKA70DRAFT_1307060 [Coprinopsis sp. MPI-PUGE-AT-0042]|nr:hypothetical protein BKA70DRAFT_1307060 [Coprinopsis sp. MPI-PUGE-AT-0042]
MVGKGKKGYRPPRKVRPCNNFDADGCPIGGGCSRSAEVCHFIHPEDPEWARYRDRHNEDYLDTRRSRFNEDERERDHGWGARQTSTGLSSPVISTRPAPVFVPASVPQTPIDTSAGGMMDEPVSPEMDLDTTSPVSPTFLPAPTPVLGPPPHVPDAPGFEDIDILGSAPDIVMDARKKMWSDRVKLLAEAIKAWKAHTDAAEEKVFLEALEGRPGLSLGPDNGETALDAFRAALNVQTLEEEALKTKVDEIVDSLVTADTGGTAESVWPMTPAQMDDEFAKQDQYNEIVRYVRDLRGAALKIWESLDEDAKKGTQPPDVPVLSQMPEADQNASGQATPMDGGEHVGGRHKKRKLNDGRAAEDLSTALMDKINALEDTLTKLDVRRQEEEQRALNSIEEMIDIRLLEFQENEIVPEFRMEDLGPATRQQLADVGQGIADADTQVRTVAKGMEDCARRLNTLVVDYPAAVQAYNDAVQRHETNQNRISDLFDEQKNSQQAINALQNAFRALIAQQQQQEQHQQPSPPASPRLPSCDVMVAAEAVEEFRRDVKERMETEVGALIGDVAAKVEQTVGIIMKISDKLEELPQLQQ